MKKVLALLIALMPVLASAKITLGEVTISGEKSEVTVMMNKNKPKYYCIPVMTDHTGTHEIWVKPKEAAKFHTALFEAKAKFKEWAKVAEDNNVGEFEKDMPVRFPTVTYVWGHGDLFFCDAPFKLTFRRTKEGDNFAALYIHVTAATNRFVDENFIVLLMGEEELDTFLDTFSSKNIEKVMLENADYDPNTDKRTVDDSLFK